MKNIYEGYGGLKIQNQKMYFNIYNIKINPESLFLARQWTFDCFKTSKYVKQNCAMTMLYKLWECLQLLECLHVGSMTNAQL